MLWKHTIHIQGSENMSLLGFLRTGLTKSRNTFFRKIGELLKGSKGIDEVREDLEETLILADVGVVTTEKILSELENRLNGAGEKDPLEELKGILVDILGGEDVPDINTCIRPYVISVVGVNGTGKTTTIAKLAHMLIMKGKKVVLAAADTFRAAAIEQLKIWGERVGATVIAHDLGADAGAVAYDAVNHAKARGKDVVIIDTAGRLHTKHNLMEELKKIHRVVGKVVNGAPHEVLLVIDATTGQNGLMQARVFKDEVGVTGVVVTKLDGTAKGGIVIPIRYELGVPIKLVGFGEGLEDLKPFSPRDYVEALLS